MWTPDPFARRTLLSAGLRFALGDATLSDEARLSVASSLPVNERELAREARELEAERNAALDEGLSQAQRSSPARDVLDPEKEDDAEQDNDAEPEPELEEIDMLSKMHGMLQKNTTNVAHLQQLQQTVHARAQQAAALGAADGSPPRRQVARQTQASPVAEPPSSPVSFTEGRSEAALSATMVEAITKQVHAMAKEHGVIKLGDLRKQLAAELGQEMGSYEAQITAAVHMEVVEMIDAQVLEAERCERRARIEAQEVFDTKLLEAATAGRLQEVKTLIELGADVDCQTVADAAGGTTCWRPVLAAAAGNHSDTLRYLLDAGASLDHAVDHNVVGGTVATNGSTTQLVDALYLAAANGHKQSLTVLLDAGMESQLHIDFRLLAAAGTSMEVDDAAVDRITESWDYRWKLDMYDDDDARLNDDQDCGSDDCESCIERRFEEYADEAMESSMRILKSQGSNTVRAVLSDCFAARARLQAYRRLAVFAVLNDRLGADSSAGKLNVDMLDSVMHAMGAAETVTHTMKDSTHPWTSPGQASGRMKASSDYTGSACRVMRGAPAKAAEINRFEQQGWAWEATAVFRIAPGGFNLGGGTAGGNRAAGVVGGTRAKRKGRGKR